MNEKRNNKKISEWGNELMNEYLNEHLATLQHQKDNIGCQP